MELKEVLINLGITEQDIQDEMEYKHNNTSLTIKKGDKSNKLEVYGLCKSKNKYKGRKYVIAKCECGEYISPMVYNWIEEKPKSCGCLFNRASRKNENHGLTNTRLYREWCQMKKRCKPTWKQHKDYYDRGITVCEEWDNSFTAFLNWSLSNGYNDDLTLDRIDNNKGYYPDNCRWATVQQQANNRRTNRYIKFNGETKTLTEWCKLLV